MDKFSNIKIGDIIYKRHNVFTMEGWWIVESEDNTYTQKGFKCALVHSRISSGCSNTWCNFTLYENAKDLSIVGTMDDFPEWTL